MGWVLWLVWGAGGGDEGVSISIAGYYDRAADPGLKIQNFGRLIY